MAKDTDRAILFDSTLCMACRGCQAACKEWNETDEDFLPSDTTMDGSYENPPNTSIHTWLLIEFNEVDDSDSFRWLFNRRSCMHCTNAGCVLVCPTGALFHHDLGFVSYNKDICTGCGYCVSACPFNVPRLSESTANIFRKQDKCTFCTTAGLDRISQGWQPACVKSCPPRALRSGNWADMVAYGKDRVQTLQGQGHGKAHLYGEKELDGLHVLYVLDDAPEVYRLPSNPEIPAVATIDNEILTPVGLGIFVAGAFGLGINYFVARANAVRETEKEKEKEKEKEQ